MKNKYTSRFSLISLLALLCSISSCTYDYFEDETNYVVYVPKADREVRTDTYKVDEVKILIYNNRDLERERHSFFPFEDNPRTKLGNFNFKLYPGSHFVYCFSNTKGIDFSDVDSYSTAAFSIREDEESIFKGPQKIMLESIQRNILIPGPLVEDTAYFERNYSGRICVLLNDMHKIDPSLTVENIKRVDTRVRNIGTKQMLSKLTDSIETRATRSSESDLVLHSNKLTPDPISGKNYDYGFFNYYFPSLDYKAEGLSEEIPIEIQILFIGHDDKVIDSVTSYIVDKDKNYMPVVLHTNQTIYLLLDGKNINVISIDGLEEWNDVDDDGGQSPEGGTII